MNKLALMSAVPVMLVGALFLSTYKLEHFFFSEPASCMEGGCPLKLRRSDSGKTFIYPVSTRFDLMLNGTDNPQNTLSVACDPDRSLGSIAASSATPPSYHQAFEALTPGTCKINDLNFWATVIVQ